MLFDLYPDYMQSHSKFLEQLSHLKLSFGPSAAKQKLELLKELRCASHFAYKQAELYHEILLFLLAYPDNPQIQHLANSEISRIAAMINPASDCGAWGTQRQDSFSYDLLTWLTGHVACMPRFDKGSLGENFDQFLQCSVLGIEGDAVLNGDLTSEELMDLLAAGKGNGLRWLLKQIKDKGLAGPLLDRFIEDLDLWIRWEVPKHFSTTFVRFKKRPFQYFPRALKETFDLKKLLKKALPRPVALSKSEVKELIDTARMVLCSRGRETDPVTYANPHEALLFRLEKGIDIAIFGLLPERRLPIESYFGYVAARNCVPLAYGGGWTLGGRCEIGINIFDPFRGGDSSLLLAQILRVYHQYFGVNLFAVQPQQFGDDNQDGINSGAFWFYYKLGFRPEDPKTLRFAEKEALKKRRNGTYRSSTAALKKLTESRLQLSINKQPCYFDVADIGLGISAELSQQFAGNRQHATSEGMKCIDQTLGTKGVASLRANEKEALQHFAPLVSILPGWMELSSKEKLGLIELFLLKRSQCEREFALRGAKDKIWLSILEQFERRGLKLGAKMNG